MFKATSYFFVSIIAVLLFSLVAVVLLSTPSSAQSSERAQMEITQNDHIYGNQDAEVFLVKYSDFSCPYCRSFFNHIVKQAIQEYDGQVALVYRHYPVLNQNSLNAAKATECVAELGGNDAFWNYADLLFTNPRTSLQRNGLIQHASQVGVDQNEFVECIDSNRHESTIQPNRSLPIQGVPTTFIVKNNEVYSKIHGSQPLQTVREHIDNALAEETTTTETETTTAPETDTADVVETAETEPDTTDAETTTKTDTTTTTVVTTTETEETEVEADATDSDTTTTPSTDTDTQLPASNMTAPRMAMYISSNYLPEWRQLGVIAKKTYKHIFLSPSCCADIALYADFKNNEVPVEFNEANVFLTIQGSLHWTDLSNNTHDINKVINAIGVAFNLEKSEVNAVLASIYFFAHRSAPNEITYLTQSFVLGDVYVKMRYGNVNDLDISSDYIKINFSRIESSPSHQIIVLPS